LFIYLRAKVLTLVRWWSYKGLSLINAARQKEATMSNKSYVKVTRIKDRYGRTAYLYSYENLELIIRRHDFVNSWNLETTGKRVDLPNTHWASGYFTDCRVCVMVAPCKKHLVGIAKYTLTNGAEGEQWNYHATSA
tara:strand:- start:579 stop:986 length:408 start_codon:yes stop_codon:yes gene_type:complete